MGIHVGSGKSFPVGWSTAAKPCDSCKSVAALLFCRVDSAFLCTGCDSRIHVANGHGHERVWMCEVCEQAPASVTCKADAAALCVTCDRDIHSANPLAHRHERIPAVPFYENTAVKSAVTAADDDEHSNKKDQTTAVDVEDHEEEEEVPDSWIDLSNSCAKLFPEAPEMKSIDYLFSESDQLLDLDYPISLNTRFQHNLGTDSVVPIQTFKTPPPNQIIDHNHFEIDFTHSKLNPYKSLTQSVSSSSMDVGIVPDGGSMSEMSYTFAKYSNSAGIDLSDSGNTTVNQASQLTGMDREARVLRYREKRKNRKFEKTIRYASRKAYAETRPRIKGRFAKRTEIDSEVDHLFTSSSSAFMPDSGYGVVPSY